MTSLQADYLLTPYSPPRCTSDQVPDLSKHVARQPPNAFRSMTEDGLVKMLDSESNGPKARAVYRLLRQDRLNGVKPRQTLAILRVLHGQTTLQFPDVPCTNQVIVLNIWSEAAALGAMQVTEAGQLSILRGLISLTGPMDLLVIMEPGAG